MGLHANSAEGVVLSTFDKATLAEFMPDAVVACKLALAGDSVIGVDEAESCTPDGRDAAAAQEEEAANPHDDHDVADVLPDADPGEVAAESCGVALPAAAVLAEGMAPAMHAETWEPPTPEATQEPASGSPARGPPPRPLGYLQAAARDFRQPFAHRLRWEHAVNSWSRLKVALRSDVNLLEADVSSGPLLPIAGCEEEAPGTSVCTADGGAVIMAHYPTERKSDLSLERFVQCVLEHNRTTAVNMEQLEVELASKRPAVDSNGTAARDGARLPLRAREGCADEEDVSTDDEATAFAGELDKELDRASSRSIIPSCAGSRKMIGSVDSWSSGRIFGGRKGIKLDFKQFRCVEPTLQYLRKVGAVRRLGGHLWLNADVFAGPGALVTPLDAQKFVRHCAEYVPEAVLSLGWGATVLSTTRQYTHEMIERMIELCMCPIVKHSLPCARSAPSPVAESDSPCDVDDGWQQQQQQQGGSSSSCGGPPQSPTDDDVTLVVAPAMACRHITFAVAAEYALASAKNLNRLLELMPTASLTIYTGVGSLGVTPATVQDLLVAFGKRRCFFDLRVTRPWRSWFWGGSSAATSPGSQLPQPAASPKRATSEAEAQSTLTGGSSCGPPIQAEGRRWSLTKAPAAPNGAASSDVIAII